MVNVYPFNAEAPVADNVSFAGSVRRSYIDAILPTVLNIVNPPSETNGTLLDGQKLEPKKGTRLKGGEIVTLGRYAFMFQPADGFLAYVRGLIAQGA